MTAMMLLKKAAKKRRARFLHPRKSRVSHLRASASARGSVLIVVLIICLGLVSLTLVFGHAMLMAYRGTDNDIAGREANQAIEGAARYAQYIIMSGTLGVMPDRTTYQNEAVPVGDAQFWFIGRPGDNDPIDKPIFGLIDEASKLNINSATIDMLEALPGMTTDLAAAILDWRDADETPNPNGGAESETYMLSQPPYRAKDAPFESTEELALVNGADMPTLYGQDTNFNGILDPSESGTNGASSASPASAPVASGTNGNVGNSYSGVLEYLTAFSREPNTRSDGSKRVNVSTGATQNQRLTALLSGTFGAARAAQIARALGTSRPKSTLEFFIRSHMTEDEFNQIADDVTVSSASYIVGLVNVNTASPTVLACIPGIGVDSAASLVAARAALASPPTSVAWVASVLKPAAAFQAGPYLTVKSYQFTADAAAVGHNGRGYRRTLFIIDNTGALPRIVYRRNMAQLGWALGDDVRQALATQNQLGQTGH